MKSTIKVWTGLGLATALVGAGLAGCAGEGGEGGEGADSSVSGEAGEGEAGEGEGGEGEGGEGEGGEGEGGEGGVAVGDAASDPVVYGAALAIVEAHAIAGLDAYAVGKTNAAAEMFGHPVSEVLTDMAPVFEKLGVEDFTAAMNEASRAALKADNEQEVSAAYKAIMAALEEAAAKAPTGDLSKGAVTAGVVADQIGRAASMYREATGNDTYEPYLDGYGYYKAAARAFERDGAAIETYNSGLHSDITAALDLLATAYPSAERPAALEVEEGKLLGASSKVDLGLPTA
ncbi:MAG: hypothetical protein QNI87_10390 [Erythrobacter sp.]|uniref:hypothetical protein n=1 Tax=Erythrobacter sp. TaxID=1042 RepID=UPI002616D117|nr:hypothetical protein [Erythrobacter sp.]MDJ0978933.1 hypothetical protein [Erythrobacter sp.]